MTSFSSLKVRIQHTGPKISSREIRVSAAAKGDYSHLRFYVGENMWFNEVAVVFEGGLFPYNELCAFGFAQLDVLGHAIELDF
jgi:hypothetical protein